ncbi:MAG: rhlE [Frankiales bacterium]|nr:rhlE [Frankiales bacterium]
MSSYTRRPRTSSSSRPRTSRPAAPVKSALEIGLDAAAELSLAEADQPVPTFQSLGLPDRLISALARRDVTAPFAIQARALPDAVAGRDVLGRGQTGSGKTLAFGLPMLTRLVGGTRAARTPRGLVLVPTRELAQQVNDALAPLGQALDLKVMTIYGGASMGRQIDQLRRGADIVVATPGRLQDLINQRECDLSKVEITVLDEADHMADLGFMPAVTALLDLTPASGQRMLFSATLDRGVDKLALGYLKDPAMHAVAPAASPVDTMDHLVFAVQRDSKVTIAAEIANRPARTLFFVRTKHGADRLAEQLSRTGVNAAAIHGNLTQSARKRALDDFTTGHSRVLVATDVAARGIHVDDVDLVVHYDPPADFKDYLHRSGRTARAGARGTVLSFILGDQVRDHQRMRERAGVEANAISVVPGHPDVRAIAESGEAIEVQPRIRNTATGSNRRPGGPGGRPRRSGPPSAGSAGPRGYRGSTPRTPAAS